MYVSSSNYGGMLTYSRNYLMPVQCSIPLRFIQLLNLSNYQGNSWLQKNKNKKTLIKQLRWPLERNGIRHNDRHK